MATSKPVQPNFNLLRRESETALEGSPKLFDETSMPGSIVDQFFYVQFTRLMMTKSSSPCLTHPYALADAYSPYVSSPPTPNELEEIFFLQFLLHEMRPHCDTVPGKSYNDKDCLQLKDCQNKVFVFPKSTFECSINRLMIEWNYLRDSGLKEASNRFQIDLKLAIRSMEHTELLETYNHTKDTLDWIFVDVLYKASFNDLIYKKKSLWDAVFQHSSQFGEHMSYSVKDLLDLRLLDDDVLVVTTYGYEVIGKGDDAPKKKFDLPGESRNAHALKGFSLISLANRLIRGDPSGNK
jgi:hypothetical protein